MSEEELPEEYARLDGKQSYIVCAFYTPNYLPQITQLKLSLEEQGLSHFLKRYERAQTWEATTRIKPVFVDHCLAKFPDKDILYLDADAVVRKPLTFLDGITTDIGMLLHPHQRKGRWHLRLSAGTLFLRNTEGGRRFARLWKEAEAKAGPLTVDEDMIYMALRGFEGITLTLLPYSYYKIFDARGPDPVIEHFQASRTQFKWSRSLKVLRRWAIGAGIAAAAAALALLVLMR